MTALSDQFLGDMPVLPGAHFLAPEEIDRIDVNTVLERPKAMVCRVIPEANSISIQFPGTRMRTPKQLGPALEFIAMASRFKVGDLPGGLSDKSKLTVAKRLVRDGVLTIVDHGHQGTNSATHEPPELCPAK